MYSAAMPSQDIGRAAELLTITFLASIALYFSSERPQPLTMTVIDFIFAGFMQSLELFQCLYSYWIFSESAYIISWLHIINCSNWKCDDVSIFMEKN
ncbi:MAG: hypothetical protein CM15mP123_13160 [Gammaproteobacteria bacterium]|nr:MAG: hypothetical protein CM15mP123_13160 [Gammaproteobacteria bacterium]